MPDEPSNSNNSAKLSIPAKRSFFERQKAEAEAKRVRAEKETAAVYEDFVKSFEDDSSAARHGTNNRPLGGGGGGGGGPPRRHFTTNSLGPRKAGPGTLGPPPQAFSRRKTAHDVVGSGGEGGGRVSRDHQVFSGSSAATSAFHDSDDEDDMAAAGAREAERAAAKPTLYLAALPPGTSPAAIKSLIPSTLTVDNVRILPQLASTERKSTSAIVTLANESAASDIDSAVSALQNKYLGYGYHLSISRHLSSVAIGSTTMPPATIGPLSTSSNPFGAKSVGRGVRRAPSPRSHRHGGAFAPPPLGPQAMGYGRSSGALQVIEVQTPSDLKQLQLIHRTLESLLTHGPEFEALLMSRPEVQRDEKWAWLWDPRSAGGVYYRWKLWDIVTNAHPRFGERSGRGRRRDPVFMFEGGAGWIAPESNIKFEYTTQLDEFVSDEDYDSSDEELSDREEDRRGPSSKDVLGVNDGLGYMNPLQKAKLTHLLARLPTTIGKLRNGDIARVTAFTLDHSGAGADEAVDMIVSNIINPFAYTGANPEKASSAKREGIDDAADRSSAKLVGLYVISDILSSSATSGVRHAWRYRQLFESALKSHKVFEHLGRLEKDLKWGRLKAEKWKRSVGSLLSLWEGWCVFPQSGQEHFVDAFENPPLTEREMQEEREKAEAERAAHARKGKGRWKAVDVEDDAQAGGGVGTASQDIMDIDRRSSAEVELMSDIDGVPMEDSDLEEDADGEPFDDDDDDTELHTKEQESLPQQGPKSWQDSTQREKLLHTREKPLPPRRPRPRAEDMFADSE